MSIKRKVDLGRLGSQWNGNNMFSRSKMNVSSTTSQTGLVIIHSLINTYNI